MLKRILVLLLFSMSLGILIAQLINVNEDDPYTIELISHVNIFLPGFVDEVDTLKNLCT